jgi:uncharacterized membrane protein YqhA
MKLRKIERKLAIAARLTTFFAVVASSVGAAVMIAIGVRETVSAILSQVEPEASPLPAGDATAIRLISSLDRFLMAIVLLYFAYGIYALFVRPDDSARDLGIPDWLNVEGIGQLKQTLAEVIVVVLFVLFLRVALETFIARGPNLTWLAIVELLTLPVAIFLLSAALKLAELHPKPRPRGAAPASEPEDGPHEVTSSTGAPRLAKPRPPRSESARPR